MKKVLMKLGLLLILGSTSYGVVSFEYLKYLDDLTISSEAIEGSKNLEKKDEVLVFNRPYENGVKALELEYVNGKREGEATFYSPEGVLIAKGKYKNNKRDGVWEFYDNNILRDKVSYKDDLLDGEIEAFYEDGKLQGKGNYVKGLREGLLTTYYPNGEKYQELNYSKGLENGTRMIYYTNGNLFIKGKFVNDKEQGNIEYYTQGVIILKGKLDENTKDGIFEFYGTDGKVKYKGKLSEIGPKFINEYIERLEKTDTRIPEILQQFLN